MDQPLAGRCPECGFQMVKRKYVEGWDSEDNPTDINEYWVCDRCKIAWGELDTETMEEYKKG